MAVLDENTTKEVSKRFEGLNSDVTLVYFGNETAELNSEIKGLLNEVAALSDKVKLEEYDLEKDKGEAEKHMVNDGPVTLFRSEHVKGDVRFYGMPSGYEFGTMIELIKLAGGELKVNDDMVKFFDSIDGVKLEVFTTPQCPHCPASVYVALKFAMSSPKVKGYAYEAMEFKEIAQKYKVMSVPKTVINEGKAEFVGGYPEDVVFVKIKEALGSA